MGAAARRADYVIRALELIEVVSFFVVQKI
jgi:hypothetical protein